MDLLTKRKSRSWILSVLEKQAKAAWMKAKGIVTHHFDDGALMEIRRGDKVENVLRLGPNSVYAFITHPDNSMTLLGESHNLLTNIGRDVWSSWMGAFNPTGNTVASNVSTGVGSSSITGTGSVWTASNLATPQLGVASWRVYAAPHTSTNPVVYGNVISNTTNVLTIDQWWKVDDTLGTTPTSGDGFAVAPGGVGSVRFMALTTNSGAPSASDTVLTGEITNNGANRSKATYAHTQGGSTFTMQVIYSITGTITAIHKMGLFTTLSQAGADPLVFESALNQDATVGASDQITVTDTITPTGT